MKKTICCLLAAILLVSPFSVGVAAAPASSSSRLEQTILNAWERIATTVDI